MRRRWDHVTPEGCQEHPADNTSAYVRIQINEWVDTDTVIHPEIAMEIAAWWHSPAARDTAVTRFSHTGYVAIHGIDGWDDSAGYGEDLSGSLRWILGQRGHLPSDLMPVRALAAYVEAVEREATQYRRSLWHGGGHRWTSTGTTDHDSCLTCGVEAVLRPEPGSEGAYGCYYGGDGELIISCTGRTDLVHGGERLCEGATGCGCDGWLASDGESCEHVNHTCNCVICYQ